MTSAQLKTMLSRIPVMTSLFANGASTVRNILFETSTNGLRWDNGFPDNPYAKKLSEGGKHVLLGDMNGMAKAASTGLYIRQNGGTNEFSETVLLSDKGFKGDDENWGYPKGAIIDWWKGNESSGTLRKVMCIKDGVGPEEGNCTLGPDDTVHGVEGSGEKWWKDITYSPRRHAVSTASFSDVMTYSDATGTYTITRSCIIDFYVNMDVVNNWGHSQGNISTTDTIIISVPMTKGDIFYFTTSNSLVIYLKSANDMSFRSFMIDTYSIERWGSTETRFKNAGLLRAYKYEMTN